VAATNLVDSGSQLGARFTHERTFLVCVPLVVSIILLE
jgi:hypothetical protein